MCVDGEGLIKSKCTSYPMLYRMDRKPDWNVFLNILTVGTRVLLRGEGDRKEGGGVMQLATNATSGESGHPS